MSGSSFFVPSTQNENMDSTMLPHQQPLQRGIDAFNAGLAAKNDKEIEAEAYQGDDPQLYFQQAAHHFRQAIHEQTDNQVLSLAYGYLTLIRFDGLDGEEKQQDITTDMLRTCEAINTLSETEQGLENIPKIFQDRFLAMIERLYELYNQYEDRNKWCARLIAQIREYRQQQQAIVGTIESYAKVNEYRDQKIKDIDTVKHTFTLLQQYMPAVEVTPLANTSPH